MPASASPTMSQKIPLTPMNAAAIGPATSAIMKEAPIVIPIIAIALVRFSSRVRSATSARITEPTAPAPCNARPMITPPIDVEFAATALPIPNRASPKTIMALRPNSVGQQPERYLQEALCEAVYAERLPDQVRCRTRKTAGVGLKHRIDHE